MCFDITISENIVAEPTEYFYLYITNTTPFDVRIAEQHSMITILDDGGKATICCTVYLLKIRQDKNNYCRVLLKQIEIKLKISHQNAKVPNN